MVHDFGAEGIARDVHAVGNRVAAVVGGRVAFSVDSLLGPVQWDSGGVLHVFDLEETGVSVARHAGAAVPTAGAFARRQPDRGGGLCAHHHPTPVGADTTVSKSGDIYLFGGE